MGKLLQAQQERLNNLNNLFEKSRNKASDEKLEEILYKADLLTSFMYKWKEGDESIICEDFETNQEVVIELPSGLSPMDYVEKLYNKSKKLKRSIKVLETLQNKLNIYQIYLHDIDNSITILDTYRRFEDIATLKENLGLLENVQKYLYSMYSAENTDSTRDTPSEISRGNVKLSSKTKKKMKQGKKEKK